MEKKLRVWWMSQVEFNAVFYIPAKNVEEARKVMDILSVYDAFQYQNGIKSDYCNTGGVEIWDEEAKDWNGWYYEDDNSFYIDVDDYIEDYDDAKEFEEFTTELLSQVAFD